MENQPYIKKVILENFLSFEKDEVDFGDTKFIIIVGPNWSGKTSVFQAIKFCLGSNERDERYQKWSDFIRHKQDHAMVELHIQEGKRQIKIRRTVIRGQSPHYHLMKDTDKQFRKVQAGEVQELIKSLKYNPDNEFAFVSQGKIDAIKSLRPAELCGFLEQGIGISGLREEILQQKNNVTHLNKELHSLITKKSTLSINLDLIKPKLERLKEKKILLGIRKKHEDELLWANRQVLLQEMVDIGDEIKNSEKEIKIVESQKKQEEKKIKDLLIDLKNLETNLNTLLEKNGGANKERDGLIAEIQTWQQEKIEKKNELEKFESRIKDKTKLLKNFQENNDKVKKEIEVIKQEKEMINKEFDKLIKEQNELTKKIDINKEILGKHDSLLSQKAIFLNKINENEKSIKDLDNDINQVLQSLKDIEHKLDKNKWFLKDPTPNLLKTLDTELKKINYELYDIEKKAQELKTDKVKKIRNLKFLTESLRERHILLPTPINILKEEIEKRSLEAKGPIIEYLKYDDKLSYAIESILGERVIYSFIAENWDTMELLRRLKNKYNAYCNIYLPKKLNITPFSRLSGQGIIGYLAELIKCDDLDIKKVIFSVVKNCIVVNNYHSGKNLYKSTKFGGKCVTLKGEQISSLKYVYETPYIKKLKGLLSTGTQREQADLLEAEIDTLNNELSNLNVKASKLDANQKDIFNKRQSYDDLLYSLNQRQRLTNKKNMILEKKHDLAIKNSSFEKETELLQQQIKDLELKKDPKLWEWNERLKEIPAELSNLKIEEKRWDKNFKENNTISKELENKINQQNIKIQILKSDFDAKKESFRKADDKAFKTFKKLEEIEEELETLKKRISETKTIKGGLEEEKNSIERKHLELELDLERKYISLTALRKDFFTKNEDLKRIDLEIGSLISENKIEIHPLEEIKKDLQRLDKELIKYYDVDESLLVERDQILHSLKQISQNQNNLEQDIKEAMKTENKLEQTYNTKFKKVLNKIEGKLNQKFTNVNINIRCSLTLTGDFEALEVDIKAGTINNQLISCSALSGGQISMISICLILSLQEIKPSPLCMLDEAGMFLDGRNSEAAYQLIQSTLLENPIQIVIFLPKSSRTLFYLADKLIGITRTGKNDASTVLTPKLISKKVQNKKR